jgi:hypothetical protein
MQLWGILLGKLGRFVRRCHCHAELVSAFTVGELLQQQNLAEKWILKQVQDDGEDLALDGLGPHPERQTSKCP